LRLNANLGCRNGNDRKGETAKGERHRTFLEDIRETGRILNLQQAGKAYRDDSSDSRAGGGCNAKKQTRERTKPPAPPGT